MDEIMRKMEAGIVPNWYDVMKALNEGTQMNWDYDSAGCCQFGASCPSECAIIRNGEARCLNCY
jgi:hypothetical protein